MCTMWWLLLLFTAIAAGHWLLNRQYKYWQQKGVKQGQVTLIFGNFWGMVAKKQSFAEMVEMVYNMFPNTRYSGIYQFFLPILLIRDTEIIKRITVRDFDHFINHGNVIPEDSDPLWGRNLFFLTDQKWRDLRTTLTPAFTSNKMKSMFSLISASAQQFVNHFLKKEEDIVTVEMKDTFTRFANGVIANTAFGVECDSLGNRTNEFYLMGKEATDFSGFWKSLKIWGYFLFPKLYQVMKITLFSKKFHNFFICLVKSNIKSREKSGIVRPDMIHLLLEAQKTRYKSHQMEITDQDITAQALTFFFAGFDTVSSLMCFMSYELGVNPDVQQKLIQEVDDTWEACNGRITYEALLGMTYMDMVVSESLRKWPNMVATDRVCTRDYTIEPNHPDEVPLRLKENDEVWIPIFGIHRDPQYYPEPERFDPERFSEENKGNIKPYTYLPFGAGPRNCIGSRFAILETKALFFHILSHFEIVPVEKTQVPVKIQKSVNLTSEGGFWFGLKRRMKI